MSSIIRSRLFNENTRVKTLMYNNLYVTTVIFYYYSTPGTPVYIYYCSTSLLEKFLYIYIKIQYTIQPVIIFLAVLIKVIKKVVCKHTL